MSDEVNKLGILLVDDDLGNIHRFTHALAPLRFMDCIRFKRCRGFELAGQTFGCSRLSRHSNN